MFIRTASYRVWRLDTTRRRITSVLPAQPDFTLHLDHCRQPQPSNCESVLGCFLDKLRTGRLKPKKALLLHGRKAQLKSRRSNSTPTTSTFIEHQPRQVVAQSASKIAIATAIAVICLSSQLEAWCPARFAILAEGSCNGGPISYARPSPPEVSVCQRVPVTCSLTVAHTKALKSKNASLQIQHNSPRNLCRSESFGVPEVVGCILIHSTRLSYK